MFDTFDLVLLCTTGQLFISLRRVVAVAKFTMVPHIQNYNGVV